MSVSNVASSRNFRDSLESQILYINNVRSLRENVKKTVSSADINVKNLKIVNKSFSNIIADATGSQLKNPKDFKEVVRRIESFNKNLHSLETVTNYLNEVIRDHEALYLPIDKLKKYIESLENVIAFSKKQAANNDPIFKNLWIRTMNASISSIENDKS